MNLDIEQSDQITVSPIAEVKFDPIRHKTWTQNTNLATTGVLDATP